MSEIGQQRHQRRGLSGFDYFVIAGGAVNLAVIGLLIGYWLFTL